MRYASFNQKKKKTRPKTKTKIIYIPRDDFSFRIMSKGVHL